jgi:hypothetical protein
MNQSSGIHLEYTTRSIRKFGEQAGHTFEGVALETQPIRRRRPRGGIDGSYADDNSRPTIVNA